MVYETSAIGNGVAPFSASVAEYDPVGGTIQHPQPIVTPVLGVGHVDVITRVPVDVRQRHDLWTDNGCSQSQQRSLDTINQSRITYLCGESSDISWTVVKI